MVGTKGEQARVVASLAAEGGLASTLWAGPEKFSRAMKQGEAPVQGISRKESVSLKLGFASEDCGYAIDFGMPRPLEGAFKLDRVVKGGQLIVVTHDEQLTEALLAEGALRHELVKDLGETRVPGAEALSWHWPSR